MGTPRYFFRSGCKRVLGLGQLTAAEAIGLTQAKIIMTGDSSAGRCSGRSPPDLLWALRYFTRQRARKEGRRIPNSTLVRYTISLRTIIFSFRPATPSKGRVGFKHTLHFKLHSVQRSIPMLPRIQEKPRRPVSRILSNSSQRDSAKRNGFGLILRA